MSDMLYYGRIGNEKRTMPIARIRHRRGYGKLKTDLRSPFESVYEVHGILFKILYDRLQGVVVGRFVKV